MLGWVYLNDFSGGSRFIYEHLPCLSRIPVILCHSSCPIMISSKLRLKNYRIHSNDEGKTQFLSCSGYFQWDWYKVSSICLKYLIRKAIWQVTKSRISELLCNISFDFFFQRTKLRQPTAQTQLLENKKNIT